MIQIEPNSGAVRNLQSFEYTLCFRCMCEFSSYFKTFKHCPLCGASALLTREVSASTREIGKFALLGTLAVA